MVTFSGRLGGGKIDVRSPGCRDIKAVKSGLTGEVM